MRKIGIGLVLSGLLLISSSFAAAQAMWHTGTVTKEAWKDTYDRIEVNDVPYTLMPEGVRIAAQYQSQPGIYNSRRIQLKDISQGQKVMIRAQGHRIYEILVVR